MEFGVWKKSSISNVTCLKAKDCDYLGKHTIFAAFSNTWGGLTLSTVHRLCVEY